MRLLRIRILRSPGVEAAVETGFASHLVWNGLARSVSEGCVGTDLDS